MIELSCIACRTPLTAIALTDADESRAANSGETCCAVPESPAGRLDPISSEACVGAGEALAASGVPDADPDLSTAGPVQQAADEVESRQVAPSSAATHRRGFLSGVPAFVARRWAVGR